MKTIFKGNPFSIVWNIIDRSTNHPFEFTGMKVEVGIYSDSFNVPLQSYNVNNGTITAEIEANTFPAGVFNLMCRYSTDHEQSYCTYRNAFQISSRPCHTSEIVEIESYASHIDPSSEDPDAPDYSKCQLIAEELFGVKLHLPELTAHRAIADEFGNRIIDTYVSRNGLTNHIKETYNQQFTENPPLIMEGYITPEMLSEETRQMLEATGQEITNLPDGEDLTTVHGVLKLANKQHNPNTYSGLGRQYLRKNIVAGVNILTQSMIQWPNTIYIIQYDYDLRGETITIPEGCVLDFQGGSFNNGTIVLNKTVNIIDYPKLKSVIIKGDFVYPVHADWFEDLNECINNTHILSKKIILSAKKYYINKPIKLIEGISIIGYNKNEWDDSYSSVIAASDLFEGDSVVVIGDKDNNHNVKLSNINILANSNINGITVPYRFYGLELNNVYVRNANKAFSFYTFWTSIINRCNSYNSKYGFYLEGQTTTSTNINNCVVFGGDVAFYINIALNGTSFTNCAVDGSKIGFDIKYGSNVVIENLTVEQFHTSALRVENSQTKLYVNNLSIGYNYITNSHILDIKNVLRALFVNCYMPSAYMPSDTSYYCVNIEDTVKFNNIIFLSCSLFDYRSPSFKKAVHINSGVEDLRFGGLKRNIPQILEYGYGQDSITKEITSDTVFLTPIGGQRTLKANPIFNTIASENSLITFINNGEHTISFMPEGDYYGETGFIGKTVILYPNESITLQYKGNKFYSIDHNSKLIKDPRPSLNNNEIGKDGYDTNLKKPFWWDGHEWRDSEGFRIINKIGQGDAVPSDLGFYDRGFLFFNDGLNQPIWWASNKWVNAMGYDIEYKKGGTTEERPDIPEGYHVGYIFIDKTINKPIWWTGTVWIDATGAYV